MKTLNFLFSIFLISISLISKSKSYTQKTHSSIKEIGGSLLEIISNTDEINYENPNEQKTEIDNLILKAEKNNPIFLETKIQNTNNDGDKIIHKPFPEKKKKMRKTFSRNYKKNEKMGISNFSNFWYFFFIN